MHLQIRLEEIRLEEILGHNVHTYDYLWGESSPHS